MDVLIANNELKAKAFLDEIEGKKPLFIATIATTETGKIPGLSAAGANPDFTDFTPPADAELLAAWANANPSKAFPSPPTAFRHLP